MTTIQQNLLTSNTQPLVIGDYSIRQDEDGRYCLNDLHKASGGLKKHQLSNFLRTDQTQELIIEIERISHVDGVVFDRSSNMSFGQKALNVIKGGLKQGTYAVKEMVYAYAMWISAKFHLMVIRAYDALVSSLMDAMRPKPNYKTTKQQRTPLKDAVNMLVGKAKCLNYSDAYKLIHQRFNVEHIEDIPVERIPEAVTYIHSVMGEYIPKAEVIEGKAYQDKDVQYVMWYAPMLSRMIFEEIVPALRALDSYKVGSLYAYTQEMIVHVNSLNRRAKVDGVTHLDHVEGRLLV